MNTQYVGYYNCARPFSPWFEYSSQNTNNFNACCGIIKLNQNKGQEKNLDLVFWFT